MKNEQKYSMEDLKKEHQSFGSNSKEEQENVKMIEEEIKRIKQRIQQSKH